VSDFDFERHRLGGGGAFVQQRGVGDLHAGEIHAHLLEVDQRFHAALRDLGLVRRVGRVPRGVLEDVAQDDVRRVGAVVALADEAAEHLVAVGEGADLRQRLDLGDRLRQRQRRGRLDAGRDDGIGHRLQRVVADDAQHVRDLGVVRADVAFDEGGMVFEVAQRGAGVLRRGHEGSSVRRKGGRSMPVGHGRQARGPAARLLGRHARPSVLLPESFETRSAGRGGRCAPVTCSCPFGAGAARCRRAADLSRVQFGRRYQA
jgi:hypothetical protein